MLDRSGSLIGVDRAVVDTVDINARAVDLVEMQIRQLLLRGAERNELDDFRARLADLEDGICRLPLGHKLDVLGGQEPVRLLPRARFDLQRERLGPCRNLFAGVHHAIEQ